MQAFGNRLLSVLMASPAMATIAVVALVCALGLLWHSWQERRERRLMAAVPTSRAADVGKLKPGTLAEVTGTLRCAAPIISEYAGKPCAHFHAEIIRREVWYDGNQKQQSDETTTYTNIKQAPCVIEDASGRVAVDLTGATIETIESFNAVEGETNAVGELVGSFTGVGKARTSHNRRERILGFDIPIYVLGEVKADGGIGAPAKGSFLVNTTLEDERDRKLAEGSSFSLKFAAVMAAISFLTIAWAWYKTP